MSKTICLINNVDNCIDRFFDDKLDVMQGIKSLFPKVTNNPRSFSYMTAKMASCHHPDAQGYVYAFHYENPKESFEPGEYAINYRETSLDKIGMSENPQTRKRTVEKPFDALKYDHTIALFPINRYGGALALEQAILGSMPKEDHEKGEWFHSSLGVWKHLLRWHIACFF